MTSSSSLSARPRGSPREYHIKQGLDASRLTFVVSLNFRIAIGRTDEDLRIGQCGTYSSENLESELDRAQSCLDLFKLPFRICFVVGFRYMLQRQVLEFRYGFLRS